MSMQKKLALIIYMFLQLFYLTLTHFFSFFFIIIASFTTSCIISTSITMYMLVEFSKPFLTECFVKLVELYMVFEDPSF